MNFACTILASCLLIFIPSTKGVAPTAPKVQDIVIGILHHDIVIIPDPPKEGNIQDIEWEKNKKRIIRRINGKITPQQQEKYQVFENGTLKIKHLQRNDSDIYEVNLYNSDGYNTLTRTFDLKILGQRSFHDTTATCVCVSVCVCVCVIMNGETPDLKLFPGSPALALPRRTAIDSQRTDGPAALPGTAPRTQSSAKSRTSPLCSEKGLDIPLIVGICGGGVFFLLFVALLILFISKRKKQHRRENGGKLELRAHRTTSEERSRRPNQIPASAPPKAAASQAPPPPGHHPQAHGPRPPPPGHRAQHQQQRRPLPCPGAPVHQQKGPPLPTPRVQPKPPRGARENAKQSSGR
uniref:Immunoglobulin V-set domain-containing protein n=1 Tax=Myotis lucifugus TaxID=59463 RepID=G1NZK5_MYOLU